MIYTSKSHRAACQSYCNTCGITSGIYRKQFLDFSDGIYDLGLWNNMVCWPFTSSHTKATGIDLPSLGGYGNYPAYTVGSPLKESNGVKFVGVSTHYIRSSVVLPASPVTFISVDIMSDSSVWTYAPIGDRNNERGVQFVYGLNYAAFSPGKAGVGDSAASVQVGGNTNPAFVSISVTGAQSCVGFYNDIAMVNSSSGENWETTPSYTDLALVWTYANQGANGFHSAFRAMINSTITQDQHNGLNSLYKQTLGVGLGLP